MHESLGKTETELLGEGKILIALLAPAQSGALLDEIAGRKATAMAMEAIPRISRAQKMDVLSSMANIAGYRAVIEAGQHFGRFFTGQITAAGKVPPAKVMIIGAGVAGLAAIGTAVSLGAIVRAFDTRPEVKEQIESVGAKYVGIELEQDASAGGGYAGELSEGDRQRQLDMLIDEVSRSDVVITTALIGGVFAPRIVTSEMVRSMRPGSIIVDLAADGGGNCEDSVPGETVEVAGVRIIAPLNLPATMPEHASLLFSRNLAHFIETFSNEGAVEVDLEDEIQAGCLIARDGDIVHERTRDALDQGTEA